jgi:hypothetical protein
MSQFLYMLSWKLLLFSCCVWLSLLDFILKAFPCEIHEFCFLLLNLLSPLLILDLRRQSHALLSLVAFLSHRWWGVLWIILRAVTCVSFYVRLEEDAFKIVSGLVTIAHIADQTGWRASYHPVLPLIVLSVILQNEEAPDSVGSLPPVLSNDLLLDIMS